MRYRDSDDFSPTQVRADALASASVLRDCSRRVEVSQLLRRAFRRLMRAQAIRWRQTPTPIAG